MIGLLHTLFGFLLGLCAGLWFCVAVRCHLIESEKVRQFLKMDETQQITAEYGMLIHTPVSEDGGDKRTFYYHDLENVMYIHKYFADVFGCSMERVMVRVEKNTRKKKDSDPDLGISTGYMNPSEYETLSQQRAQWKKRGWFPLLEFAKDPALYEEQCKKPWQFSEPRQEVNNGQ